LQLEGSFALWATFEDQVCWDSVASWLVSLAAVGLIERPLQIGRGIAHNEFLVVAGRFGFALGGIASPEPPEAINSLQ